MEDFPEPEPPLMLSVSASILPGAAEQATRLGLHEGDTLPLVDPQVQPVQHLGVRPGRVRKADVAQLDRALVLLLFRHGDALAERDGVDERVQADDALRGADTLHETREETGERCSVRAARSAHAATRGIIHTEPPARAGAGDSEERWVVDVLFKLHSIQLT